MKPVLEIQGVSKKFNIRGARAPYLSLRENLFGFLRPGSSQEEFWALRDVSFNVMPGDTIGIVGKNGAGKSTLLKILSKITPPTTGKVIVRGRIASLLEVGTGFHPELSGRENIFLNGSILGMKRAEIKRQLDAIVDFSGVEKFLETPLKHYSSGMQLRLAFAVAAFLEPEILVIDEVLAVGDAEFQKKCLGKMEDVSRSGRTILFVSHNFEAVSSLCKTCIQLDSGKLVFSGNTQETLTRYLVSLAEQQRAHFKIGKHDSEKAIVLREASLRDLNGNEIPSNGSAIEISFTLIRNAPVEFSLFLFVFREETLSFIASDLHRPVSTQLKDEKEFCFHFTIPPYLLNPGMHRVGLLVADRNGNTEQYLNQMDLLSFELTDDGYRRDKRYHLGWSGAVSPLLDVSLNSIGHG
ncbi:MAG TPA: polysaccharide ABC transporter ATP-binding protein [Bacteroidia bacterium]|nr:polysaccharide ABC transporter ATP-binding protein [Bacteroidia bacterium]